jgi:uncharacterized protein HemX
MRSDNANPPEKVWQMSDAEREAADEADGERWQAIDSLRSGARALLMQAVKAHRAACDILHKQVRELSLQRVEWTIEEARRLLRLAAEKAEESHQAFGEEENLERERRIREGETPTAETSPFRRC